MKIKNFSIKKKNAKNQIWKQFFSKIFKFKYKIFIKIILLYLDVALLKNSKQLNNSFMEISFYGANC